MRIRHLFAAIAIGAVPALIAGIVLVGCNHGPVAPVVPPVNAQTTPTVSVKFTDITDPAGIKFTHNNGAFGAMLMPEIMGSGVAFIDYDGDGYPDIFLVNGRDW